MTFVEGEGLNEDILNTLRQPLIVIGLVDLDPPQKLLGFRVACFNRSTVLGIIKIREVGHREYGLVRCNRWDFFRRMSSGHHVGG